ncbi:glycosyltransferase [Scrofimicrobium sp. R131]|uniref:Glycosyltransferase n=1 Tax=Scrofimicrobium appendicitidis TaxID=3079930 RepID=A0AAU7V873_9ACTO
MPRVLVAMATYNGLPYLGRQVRSILAQRRVEVELFVSDDGSTDGTREWIEQLAALDPRVHLLPPRSGPAGVGANFLYLAQNLDPRPDELVAFSDQDDLWHPDKLAHQLEYLRLTGAAATSSNVLSFRPDGTSHLIVKSQPLRRWDFVFEAPGPGSTFLLSAPVFQRIKPSLARLDQDQVWLHDWLIYALVRGGGDDWAIDPRPHVAYRQHGENILGEHRGAAAFWSRWQNLRSGRYRAQFILVATAALEEGRAAGRSEQWVRQLERLIGVLSSPGRLSQLGLIRFWPQMRRRTRDRLALGALGIMRIW